MFPYLGNKKKELKEFINYIPKQLDIYVEPFGGGGAVSLALNNMGNSVHINDLDPLLVKLYKYFKTKKINKDINKLDAMNLKFRNQVINSTNPKEAMKELGKKVFNNRDDIFIDLLYRKLRLYEGRALLATNNFMKTDNGRKASIKSFTGYLDSPFQNPKQVKITKLDYKKLLSKYKQNSKAFVFLDPPYQNIDDETKFSKDYKHSGGFGFDDFLYINEFMSSSKCKVMLVINDSNYIKKLFKGMITKKYKKQYNLTKKIVNHLVITNY